MNRAFHLTVLIALLSGIAHARVERMGKPDAPQIQAIRIDGQTPKLDGRLDDPAWQRAIFVTGFDLKMGLGPNLTIDAAVNPDFGQIEADPAEVNLSAFETFFPERRPFFTEGAQLLRGSGANFFYSRRIGAPPHGFANGDFVERPNNATILGAAKLTGRFSSGLSVGMLSALTSREKAWIQRCRRRLSGTDPHATR